jgi:4-hydroxy-tetrahydrodipicolinate reductase
MNIALLGYGKMGRIIETVAQGRGHQIILRIDLDNAADLNAENISKADVAIEFSGPHGAFGNLQKCMDFGIPVVSGSTGWLDQYPAIKKMCNDKNGSFLYASNFSVGVNIFFEINKRLAQLMATQPEYDVTITEIHHTQKKDAPSGTAITIAEQILAAVPRKHRWVNHISDNIAELEIISERTDPHPGLHKVNYQSAIDEIEIIHNAHNRNGFALGAVMAAEYIKDKKGIFTMKEVLGL